MTTPKSVSSVDQFNLVTYAHHFLMQVLPFRNPESYRALATFVATLEPIQQRSPEVDAVLLRCLVVLDMQQEKRIPSLVDRYLAKASTPDASLTQFATCVEDLLRYHCISSGSVQQTFDIIGTRYGESSLNPRTLAEAVNVRLSTLDVAFKREMGCTITEHLRGVRLERAAILLVTTNKTIKEIWAEVGYNHPSNFDHDFKRRFGMTPREFRAGSIRPAARLYYGVRKSSTANDTASSSAPRKTPPSPTKSILIVDDDETTRWTVGTHLNHRGYSVSTVATGAEGLAHVKAAPPDLILLDYRLEDMDGVEFLQTLRRARSNQVPAVVLFTADWHAFDRRDDVNALNAVLASKLCDLNHVTELIQDLCARNNDHEPSRADRSASLGSDSMP